MRRSHRVLFAASVAAVFVVLAFAAALVTLAPPRGAQAQTISYPQPGSPTGVEVGALTTPRDEQFARVELALTSLSSGQRVVTKVRLCSGPSGNPSCALLDPPDGPIHRDYLIPVPGSNQTSQVTVQLCNNSGCGDFFSLGNLVRRTSAQADYYAFITGYIERSSSNVFFYSGSNATVKVEYSNGDSWSALCSAGFSCGPGGYGKNATATSAKVSGGGNDTVVPITTRNVHAFIEQPIPDFVPGAAPIVIVPPPVVICPPVCL